MYGVVCALLRVPEEHTVASFLFGTLRTMVASTVRLGVTGTLEAQHIQYKLQQTIPEIALRHKERPSTNACNVFPLADVMQNSHDLLFSRMFYS